LISTLEERKNENREGESTGDLVLDDVQGMITLLHGVFEPSIFDTLKERSGGELFVMEGRPSLESAETTCRELLRRKIKPTLIADSMAGFLFYRNLIKEVWLAYQIADEEGALCPIGSLIAAVLGKRHNVPVYVYPASKESRIMGRQKDIFYFKGVKIAPQNIKGYVPLVEWLPKKYITEIYRL
jgi:methylthioribose-1-phosphate isomerase